MTNDIANKHVAFSGRLLMLGCGSIGQGVLPLLLRHIDMPRENISILTADRRGSAVAAAFGIAEEILPITRDNFREVLSARLNAGDFLLNLSVDISSVALIKLCRALGVLYLRRALGRRLHGSFADPVAAFQLRAAGNRSGADG
jgi:homospermidine synthase